MTLAKLRPAALGVGTATFLETYGFAQIERPGVALLREAIDSGVRYLDTAAAYGGSEAAIAHLAHECEERGVRICTKIGVSDLEPTKFEADARASLERLGLKSVDTLLLHSVPGAVLASSLLDEAWSGVRRHRLAARLGASTYGSDDALLALSNAWCDSIQVEFSILNQSVIRALSGHTRRGQEVIVRSVLCKGLLTTGALSKPLPSHVKGRLQRIDALAHNWGMTLPALAIRFALDTPGIDVVLVGVASAQELDAALAAAAMKPLTAEKYAEAAACDASVEDWAHPEKWTRGAFAS